MRGVHASNGGGNGVRRRSLGRGLIVAAALGVAGCGDSKPEFPPQLTADQDVVVTLTDASIIEEIVIGNPAVDGGSAPD